MVWGMSNTGKWVFRHTRSGIHGAEKSSSAAPTAPSGRSIATPIPQQAVPSSILASPDGVSTALCPIPAIDLGRGSRTRRSATFPHFPDFAQTPAGLAIRRDDRDGEFKTRCIAHRAGFANTSPRVRLSRCFGRHRGSGTAPRRRLGGSRFARRAKHGHANDNASPKLMSEAL